MMIEQSDGERRAGPRIVPGDRGVLIFDGIRLELEDVSRGGFRVELGHLLRFIPGRAYEFDLLFRPGRSRRFRGGSVVARCVWSRAGHAGFRLADPARMVDILHPA